MSWCHGIELPIPDDWEDQSLYRFAPPSDADLKPNLVVSPTTFPAGGGLDVALTTLNRELKANMPSLRILDTGRVTSGERTMIWQDSESVHPQAQVRVHQRHLLFEDAGGRVVMGTLTGTAEDVAAMWSTLGW